MNSIAFFLISTSFFAHSNVSASGLKKIVAAASADVYVFPGDFLHALVQRSGASPGYSVPIKIKQTNSLFSFTLQ